LPHNGPGRYLDHGGFNLTTIKAQLASPTKASEVRTLKLARAFADFNQKGYLVDGVIGSPGSTGWAVFPETGKPHFALFELAGPVTETDGKVLRVTFEFKSRHKQHGLGRFRLSAAPGVAAFDRDAARKLTDPWLKLAVAYALNGRNEKESEHLGKALQANPKLGDDREAQYLYKAARAAAMVAAGAPGRDRPSLDNAARVKLRGQALDWLTAELTSWRKLLDSDPTQNRLLPVLALTCWQNDSDLAGIRDAAALAKLPAAEQKAFAQLWTDVAALLKKATPSGAFVPVGGP
jgi:hypothetical protein